MSETQTAAAAANPFDPETFVTGGGLWDGKVVTFTEVVAKTEPLKYGDGKPVLDEKGQQSYQTALYVKGISDGSDDKERHEEYSVGGKLVPTPDGEGFVDPSGAPAKFHANSNMGKLAAALKASGFDISTLIDRNPDGTIKQRLKRLAGARFVMKSEPKRGKDGKPVKDKKGYDKVAHFPVKFVGYAAGVQQAAAAPAGNGTASVIDDKAVGAVLTALSNNGGSLTRAKLISTLALQLAGDKDSSSVIALAVNDPWHKGKPWTYDGKELTLSR